MKNKTIKDAEIALPSPKTFFELEHECQRRFNENGSFWHIYTPGETTDIIFTNYEEFCLGMNIIPWCLERSVGARILDFTLMNNHIHIIMAGDIDACLKLFKLFKEKVRRFFISIKKVVDLSNFEAHYLPITDLAMLRNEIAYVNRNGYVVNSSHTPFSYIWGTSNKIYNDKYFLAKGVKFNSLSITRKRELCHSKDIDLSDKIMVVNDIIDPSSYCEITETEQYFRDAHHYFGLLTRNHEANSELSKKLCDKVFITDNEMYSAISSLCYNLHNVKQPSLMPADKKIEVAKEMHFKYNATNKQINRILKLEMNIINTLFPISK